MTIVANTLLHVLKFVKTFLFYIIFHTGFWCIVLSLWPIHVKKCPIDKEGKRAIVPLKKIYPKHWDIAGKTKFVTGKKFKRESLVY